MGPRSANSNQAGGSAAAAMARRVAKAATYAVLVAAVCLVGVVAVLPRALGYTTLVVHSGSMGDTAPVGSLVVAKPLPVDDVRAGDIVLLSMNGSPGRPRTPVLHRVLTVTRRDGDVVVATKGDANRTVDPDTHILRGTTYTPVRVIPGAGYALGMLMTRQGWTAFVLVPGSLLFGLTLNKMIEAYRAERRRKGTREPAAAA